MSQALDDLVELMRRLHDPVNGCPWDIKQDFRSIASCTLEGRPMRSWRPLKTTICPICARSWAICCCRSFLRPDGRRKGLFYIDDVARGRDGQDGGAPSHVFGDRAGVETPDDVLKNWEKDKAAKRAAEAQESALPHSVLDGISTALPAMVRALKIRKAGPRRV